MSEITAETLQGSAVALAKTVRAGEVTALQLVEGYLARITAHDTELGAFLHVAGDAARASAQELDQRRKAGFSLGPLAGLPIAIKEHSYCLSQSASFRMVPERFSAEPVT